MADSSILTPAVEPDPPESPRSSVLPPPIQPDRGPPRPESHVTGPDGDATMESASQRAPGRDRTLSATAKKRVHEVVVSTSDEEADTVKDCFWRNLEEGLLPDDLGHTDLYSSVGCVMSGVLSWTVDNHGNHGNRDFPQMPRMP